jgi:hypothetical protein
MDTNTTSSAPQLDICDSLDELSDIRKEQGQLRAAAALIALSGEKSEAAALIAAKIQELEFEVATIGCEIIGQFMEMRKRIARLEEDLSDARDELSMEQNRSSFYQRMHQAVSRA